MTNKEAIEQLKKLTPSDIDEMNALDHAIEQLKKFDGAVIAYGRQINSDTHDLYAIPKKQSGKVSCPKCDSISIYSTDIEIYHDCNNCGHDWTT